jgi:hypothetical protein
MAQSYENHAHRPTPTAVGGLFLLIAIVAFGLRWFAIGGRLSSAIGLAGLIGAIGTLLYISRIYTTRLQDRIIRLEMRVRGAALLTPEQQRLLHALHIKQVTALRFASDAELPALLERASRENMPPTEIKKAVRTWVADDART